jgi:hypothetical protein
MPAKRKTLQQEVAQVMASGTELAEMTEAEFDAALIGDPPEDDHLLGDEPAETRESTVIEDAENGPSESLTALVKRLLIETTMDYAAIVERVMAAYPGAKTTARSVASTASVARKSGLVVQKRRK